MRRKPKKDMVNTFDASKIADLEPRMRSIVQKRRDLLGPGYNLFYEDPIEIVRGEGVHLYDADGVEYLDAYNNVPSVGHCNPRVVEAIERQVRTLNTNTRYAAEPIIDYSERLLDTHAEAINRIMYTCTGSEAIDLSLRVARHATAAEGVVVTSNAYHGITSAAASISPNLGPNVPLGRHVRSVPAPQNGETNTGERLARNVAAAIEDIERHGGRFAAFVGDSLFASDGMVPDPAGFLAPVLDVVHDSGGLYIADEVQAGFGRSGEAMWGYQRHGIVPDLVPMGKPMGNGMPIAGVAAKADLIGQFGEDIRYFNTFGGNSVSIAAAAAVLDVIEDDDLLDNARTVGAFLVDRLERLAATHPSLRMIRGAGLFVALDIVDPESGAPDERLTTQVVNGLRQRHVLISSVGPTASALKIRPPLPFGTVDADRLVDEFEAILAGTRVVDQSTIDHLT